jgi:hypothetical protein
VRAFRRAVSQYFTRRNLALQKLKGGNKLAEDDFAEIYVLVRLLRQCQGGGTPRNTDVGKQGKKMFVVVTSPSPAWSTVSYFELRGRGAVHGARTGLQVEVKDTGTVELDVVLVAGVTDTMPGVKWQSVASALEVKNHGKKLTSTIADQTRGKASRIHQLPVPNHGDRHHTSRYCLVSVRGVSWNGKLSLESAGIDEVDFGNGLDAYLRRVLHALHLV